MRRQLCKSWPFNFGFTWLLQSVICTAVYNINTVYELFACPFTHWMAYSLIGNPSSQHVTIWRTSSPSTAYHSLYSPCRHVLDLQSDSSSESKSLPLLTDIVSLVTSFCLSCSISLSLESNSSCRRVLELLSSSSAEFRSLSSRVCLSTIALNLERS